MAQSADDFRLTVLNPGGGDPEQSFREGAGAPDERHPPVNFHGYAACTRGFFHRDVQRAIVEEAPVLLLLRGDFKASERAFVELKKHGRMVAVSLKETGLHQIAQQLSDPAKLSRFLKIIGDADGCIATTPEAAEIYQHVRGKNDDSKVVFIPTPYPLEDRQWDFKVPPDQQSGIFIGTREWDVPSRNHFAALLLARHLCETTGEPVTVVNFDGRKGRRLLAELKFPAGKLRLIEERKSYANFLREVATHKIVLQLDRSRVPGQVAGDALLCRTACVGGDGAIERIAFPRTSSDARTSDEIVSLALQLLGNANSRAALVVESQWRALERLSFSAVRTQLANFFARL
jgi:hypothetical protein